MWDFPYTEPNTVTCVALLLMYFLTIIYNYDEGLKVQGVSTTMTTSQQYIQVSIIALFISCFCVDGDFFRFMDVIINYNFSIGAYNYGEIVYGLIAHFVNRNYFFFRIIVWGGAFIIYCITSKRFSLNIYKSSIYLYACFPVIFCYARVSLCMSIFFLGLSFFCKPLKKKNISYLIGVLLFYSCTFFHNTGYVMILLAITIYLPINKKSLLLFIILLPVIVEIAQKLFLDVASMSDQFENEGFTNRLNRSTESDNVIRDLNLSNPGVLLHTLLQYISFYVPLFFVSKVVLAKENRNLISIEFIRLYKIAISFVCLSLIFLLFQHGSFVMFYRVLFMSMIPLSLLIVYLYNNNFMSYSYYKKCLFSGVIFTSVRIFYCFYGYGM